MKGPGLIAYLIFGGVVVTGYFANAALGWDPMADHRPPRVNRLTAPHNPQPPPIRPVTRTGSRPGSGTTVYGGYFGGK